MSSFVNQQLIESRRIHANPYETLVYKVAKSPEELEGAARIVYSAFLKEGWISPDSPDGSFTDTYDRMPSTIRFIAVSPTQIVGTIRCIRDPQNPRYHKVPVCVDGKLITKLPVEELIDLSNWRSQGRNIEQVGNLAVVEEERGKGIIHGLFKCVYEDIIKNEIHNVFGWVNPKLERLLRHIGFETLYEGMFRLDRESPLVPVLVTHLDTSRINKDYLEYLSKLRLNFQL